MKKLLTPLGASALLLTMAVAPLWAGSRELKTVESAAEAVHALAGIPLRGIPQALMQEATGVAVIPDVVSAGLVIDGRFGRGVVLVHQPDGTWSNPVFITLAGGGIGGQAGIESTDVVLVFRTHNSLERVLQGKDKITLGGQVGVAAGPVGRQAQAATDPRLKAEIWSYSRSRGLFVGASLEGAALLVDRDANEAFYRVRGGEPKDVLFPNRVLPNTVAVESLKEQLTYLSSPPPPLAPPVPPSPPVMVYPPQMPLAPPRGR